MTATQSINVASSRAAAAPPPSSTYNVRRGDTLSAIALRVGVPLSRLIAANPQISNPDLIFAGDRLNVPQGGVGAGGTYTVRGGDTLSGIAQRFGLNARDIALDNGLANPDFILAGQQLRLGGGRSRGPDAVAGLNAPVGSAAPGGGSNAADIARQYLGRNASDLRGDRSDNLPMQAGVPSNVCCANFVSAVLTEAGQLPAGSHTNSVAQLNSTLRAQGWTAVPASQARPGDVVIIQGGGVSHTELVAGNGKMIGSNNSNADGSQRIGYNNLSWALGKGAVILRAPASVRSEAPSGAPSQAGGAGAVGSPSASRDGRIDQAMTYFHSQGWSRAQAAGIVANLDAESGMRHDIRQIGGGPGFGLGQWEGPRQAAFASWAGHDIRQSTFREQLEFVQHELKTSEAGAGARLRRTDNAGDAAAIVCRHYERPADIVGDSQVRARIANAIFQR